MNEADTAEFLAGLNLYTPDEALAELDSLRTGEWDTLQVSDAGGTAYLIAYDPDGCVFIVTDNFNQAGPPVTGPLDDRITAGVAQLRSAGTGTPDAALEKMTRAAILNNEHARLRLALAEAGERALATTRARRAAMAQIGCLIREGRALRDAYDDMPRLELTDAETLTGISRPTLYAEIGRPAAGGPAGWDDRRLAVAILDGTADDAAQAEFRIRFPVLEGIRQAALIMQAATEPDPADWLKPAPGSRVIRDAYRTVVEAIAAGKMEPATAVPGADSGRWLFLRRAAARRYPFARRRKNFRSLGGTAMPDGRVSIVTEGPYTIFDPERREAFEAAAGSQFVSAKDDVAWVRTEGGVVMAVYRGWAVIRPDGGGRCTFVTPEILAAGLARSAAGV